MGNICCEEEIYAQHQSRPHSNKKIPIIQQPTVNKNQFQHQNQIKKSWTVEKQKQNNSPGMRKNSGVVNANGFIRHGPENYQSIKYLGKGTFGDVVLAEDKETGNQYAMKIIQKKKIKQINLLQNQIIQKISQNDLFIKIRQTFQNESKIYVVMEYLPRGDVYYYLKKKSCIFRQDIIRMLVAEVIMGIEILHNAGIVYRELKPQNILVTNEGHVKLGDYGLSKMLIEKKDPISTFVGTLEYTAPEVLEGHYDRKADIWAIGILMYELKFEENLFEGENNSTNDQVKSNIQQTNIEEILNNIVGKVSYDFRDLIIKLLQRQPTKRISLDEMKNHTFFQGIVWEDIPQRKNPPPLKQILESDHIKFKDPNNYVENAHRKKIETKDKQIEPKLYEFNCQQQESP